MTVGQATYYVVTWVDHQCRDRGREPRTREYGTARSKQAAIRLAERVLPPDAEYIITNLHRTVHYGHTPRAQHQSGRRR